MAEHLLCRCRTMSKAASKVDLCGWNHVLFSNGSVDSSELDQHQPDWYVSHANSHTPTADLLSLPLSLTHMQFITHGIICIPLCLRQISSTHNEDKQSITLSKRIPTTQYFFYSVSSTEMLWFIYMIYYIHNFGNIFAGDSPQERFFCCTAQF